MNDPIVARPRDPRPAYATTNLDAPPARNPPAGTTHLNPDSGTLPVQ
jgi:hypothetical protein